MLLSKALTCINFFLYKQKWLFYHGDEYLWPIYISQTDHFSPQHTVLSTQQHAYQSFLSHFLVLFRLQYCGILGEF